MPPSIIYSVKNWIKNGELAKKFVIQPSPKDSCPSVSFIGNLLPMDDLNALTKYTPCNLLAYVHDELVIVAIGLIIHPKDTMMLGVSRPDEVFKDELCVVIRGFEDISPTIQPRGADSQFTLAAYFGWQLQWPRNQIQLGNVQTSATSQQRNNDNTCG